MNREEWLAQRRLGIGGSDAAAALGLSKWKTPYQLYLDKIGLVESVENESMRWGSALEPLIRQRYADDSQQEIVCPPSFAHPKYPFMLANVDGLVGSDKLLEIKTARSSEGWGEPGSDEIPDEYTLQVQHYLCVTHRTVADVAVLIGGSDYRVYQLRADREIAEMLIDGEAAFWDMVVKRTPPEVGSLEDAKRRWPKSNCVTCISNNFIDAAVCGLRVLKADAKRVEDWIAEQELAIKAFMEDADTLVNAANVKLATWKTSKPGQKFDAAAFKAAHPDIYAKFTVPSNPSRPFLLKGEAE